MGICGGEIAHKAGASGGDTVESRVIVDASDCCIHGPFYIGATSGILRRQGSSSNITVDSSEI